MNFKSKYDIHQKKSWEYCLRTEIGNTSYTKYHREAYFFHLRCFHTFSISPQVDSGCRWVEKAKLTQKRVKLKYPIKFLNYDMIIHLSPSISSTYPPPLGPYHAVYYQPYWYGAHEFFDEAALISFFSDRCILFQVLCSFLCRQSDKTWGRNTKSVR